MALLNFLNEKENFLAFQRTRCSIFLSFFFLRKNKTFLINSRAARVHIIFFLFNFAFCQHEKFVVVFSTYSKG